MLHIKEPYGHDHGTYEVRVQKRDGKPVHLSFTVIEETDTLRAQDWMKGMTRVEP